MAQLLNPTEDKRSYVTKRGHDVYSHFHAETNVKRLEDDNVYYIIDKSGKDWALRMWSKKHNNLCRTLFIGSVKQVDTFVIGMLFGRDGNLDF